MKWCLHSFYYFIIPLDIYKYKTFNKSYDYILTIIDIFSKFDWTITNKKKVGDFITQAFEIIFKDSYHTKMCTDKGLEIINKSTQTLLMHKDNL